MSPAKIFNIVDFPEPEGPTIANFFPAISFKLILFNTLTSPQLIERFLVSTASFDCFKIYTEKIVFDYILPIFKIKKGCVYLNYN